MELNRNLLTAPDLETTIDRNPLIIPPETSLQEAIALMSQARGSSCVLADQDLSEKTSGLNRGRSSCALVMQDGKLLGILGDFSKRNYHLTRINENIPFW